MALFLASRWLYVFLLTVVALAAFDAFSGFAQLVTAAFFALSYPAHPALLHRWSSAGSAGFRRLRPQGCSIYDRAFWRHERFWKVSGSSAYLLAFDGTPLKNVIWRLLGARIGRRVFDDGLFLPERTFTAIGDDCSVQRGQHRPVALAGERRIQVRPDRVGAGCTAGRRRVGHYGAKMDDGGALAANAFLMKGEEMPPRALWAENPAREM